jgi:hypothetical protein
MKLLTSLYLAALFVILTPGILLTLPARGSRLTVAVVHGIVFVVIYQLTIGLVEDVVLEGYQRLPTIVVPTKPGVCSLNLPISYDSEEYIRRQAAFKLSKNCQCQETSECKRGLTCRNVNYLKGGRIGTGIKACI